MAFEPGGYADKLGNRYEGLWVARQMLLLLSERLTSISLESVGDDETGVDLWITRLDGTREAQQCKAENGTKFNWSLNDLNSRGVLAHLKMQLQRDCLHRFTFVSGTPANQLRDLSRSASDSTGNSESFYEHQIQSGSKDRRDAFTIFCKCLGLSESSPVDRETAFDLLSRSGFHSFSDDREQREELKWMANQSVVGDSNAVISLLANFVGENLRKTIIASDVRSYLKQSGFEPRALLADERIEPKLEELRCEFKESIGPHLAGGKLIPRTEVDQLKAILFSEEHVDAIVFHGKAGHGKSGILYQLCHHLDELGTPYLALRLDRKTPSENPQAFGRKLGLPDSPVNSLCAISGDRHCILVLDQLDALRWTSAHATEGIDVCKALLREVRAMRLFGRRISIVLSCRTYDLEHDPQIKLWLKESKSFKLEKVLVNDLPDKSVQEFVSEFNVDCHRMTSRRRSLLKSVQNLSLWAEVMGANDCSPEFDSGSDLLRAFWRNRRQELEKAGFTSNETQRLLDTIVDYMEKNCSLSAPRRIVEAHEGLASELQTLNVIHLDRQSISFCHQSHLDFLIASRAIDGIATSNESIVDWLGNKSQQSIFRREQLRQLLYLLADEEVTKLSHSIDSLIASNEVRFHIKQLAIETVGQLRPSPELQDFVFSLLDREEWRHHVLRDVIHGNEPWIEALHEGGRLVSMLLSKESSEYGTAVWLLNSVGNRLPLVFDSVLEAATNAGLSNRLFNSLLFSDAESETDRVFKFRLSTIPSAVEPAYVRWDSLSQTRPDRIIELLAAFLHDWFRNRETTKAGRQQTVSHGNDSDAIRSAARCLPKQTIRMLFPVLTRFAECKINEHRAWKNRAKEDSSVRYPNTRFPKILLTVFRTALVALAKRNPTQFLELNRRLEKLRSRSVQALLACGWSALPAETYANQAVEWLLADCNRLRCGSNRRKPRWCLAARLVSRMSPHCSSQVFKRLEATLQRYRDPDETRFAAWWLRHARNGYYRNGFGAAAHYLLPALDLKRRSDHTTGRIGVLQEKFAGYPNEHFLSSKPRGGTVRSPLESNSIYRMSDKQWLRLIKNQEIPSRDGAMNFRKYEKNRVTESSVDMFARDFGIAAKREPERFGKLALRFPVDAPADYLAEVFSALEETSPPGEVQEENREYLLPASRELVNQVLDSVNLSDDNNLMRRFCWLVLKRTDLRPSDRIVSRLVELTTYSDQHYDVPKQMYPSKNSTREQVHHFETIAINHVRALAISAIGSILYEHKDLFTRFELSLESALSDPHPAVRLAIVGVCLQIWNFNRRLAIDWFIKAASPDLWPACGQNAQRLLNCAFPEFSEQLTPLIQAMVSSQEPSISEEGAEEAFARWLFFDVLKELASTCRSGSEPQRTGVAKIAVQFARNEKYAEKCLPILVDMCNDPVDEIRRLSALAFHDERLLKIPNASKFMLEFIGSEAFEDDPDSLCNALHDFGGTLTQFTDVVFAAVQKAINILHNPSEKQSRRMGLLDLHLSGVILRALRTVEFASTRQDSRRMSGCNRRDAKASGCP